MSDDFYDEFENTGGDGERHPAWSWNGKPEGTVFAGTILDRFKFVDKKSKRNRMAFIVETKNGPMALFVSQWKLERALGQARPEVGQTLKIRYDGIDAEDGQSKDFSVKVEGEPTPVEPEAQPEPENPKEFSDEPF